LPAKKYRKEAKKSHKKAKNDAKEAKKMSKQLSKGLKSLKTETDRLEKIQQLLQPLEDKKSVKVREVKKEVNVATGDKSVDEITDSTMDSNDSTDD
jgi:predicted P-loop ATPase